MTLESRPTTAVVPVAPDLDEAVIRLRDEIVKARDYALARTVKTAEDAELATNDLSIISRLKKELEAKRSEYTSPLEAHKKNIIAIFNLILDPLLEADKATRNKVIAFKQEQERLRQKAEEVERLRREAEVKAQELLRETGEIVSKPAETPVIIPVVSSQVHAELGTAGLTKNRKYRVIDFAALPDQYKLENSVLLNKVVKAGIPSIPGVEMYFEEGLRVTPKKDE